MLRTDILVKEKERLISAIIEIAKIKKIGFLVTMDIEKAFDSLDHKFLIYALEKCGFGKNFISWVKILLRNKESCLNSGNTTKYFLLERGAHQVNPISAFLFILALEILFHLIKSKPEIKGLAIFDHCYLFSAYADDAAFFLQDTIYIKQTWLMLFNFFSYFSGLKPNLTKSEIPGIGVLKEVEVAVCGLCCIDLNNGTLKILGIHFSYNKKLKKEKICKTVTDIHRVLKIWIMRNLTEKGKIVIFKIIAISKIVSQSFITTVAKHIIDKLKKIHKAFLWKNSTLKKK